MVDIKECEEDFKLAKLIRSKANLGGLADLTQIMNIIQQKRVYKGIEKLSKEVSELNTLITKNQYDLDNVDDRTKYAKHLKEKGKTEEEISKELDKTIKTIQKYLTE